MLKQLLLLASVIFTLTGDVSSTYADSRRLIVMVAQRYGVPTDLALRVAEIESGCDCYARGTHGELGPLQIKPATARMLGYEGPDFALQTCGEGLEWGMKHLALALQLGGVWKHNQGLWAKQKSAYGAKYERTVLATYIASRLVLRQKIAPWGNRLSLLGKTVADNM
jgi:transglycosylase-like protein with SLT domain